MKNSVLVLISAATLMACKKNETTSTESNTDSSMMAVPADSVMAVDSTTMSGMGDNQAGNLSEQDKMFANEAAKGGMTEAMLGQLGADNGTNAKVKSHGQMMVSDHTKANEELKSWAASAGYTLPAAPDAAQQKIAEDLKAKKGAEFDRAYTDIMVSEHEKAINLFRKQSTDGSDAALKAFATKTLPTLEQHLQHTKEVRDAVK